MMIENRDGPDQDKYGWVVFVGWLQGKVMRQQMHDWCTEQWPESPHWAYSKGGSWYFETREQATMFELTWHDALAIHHAG
mgnify:CR=1 FL=1